MFRIFLFPLLFGALALIDSTPAQTQNDTAKEAVKDLLQTTDFTVLVKKVNDWKRADKSTQKFLVVELAARFENAKAVPLNNYADLFIMTRVTKGKMPFHGHGQMIEQDIFVENGRCAWVVEQLLNTKLPVFSDGMPTRETENTAKAAYLAIIKAMAMP